MQKKQIALCCSLLLLLLAGCAGPTEYTRPEVQPVPERTAPSGGPGAPIVIDKPREAVWRQLMASAPNSNFVVVEASPKTWTLHLRYTGDPKDYIDCGRVRSPVKTAQGERVYDFAAAKAYQQYELQTGGRLYLVDRRMNIDARASVTLEALAQARTRASVATRYVVTRDQSVTGNGKPFALTDTIRFGGQENATFPNAPTNCHATGQFEGEVLGFAKR